MREKLFLKKDAASAFSKWTARSIVTTQTRNIILRMVVSFLFDDA
jgi:hypothetical protein